MTFTEFLESPARPANQRGTVFIDMLGLAGKHDLANALAFTTFDPFGKSSVSKEAIDFCRRCW